MGRLDGFSYLEVSRRLQRLGYDPAGRQGGSHVIWRHRSSGRTISVPRHSRDMRGGTLRAILHQADIGVDAFLAD